MGQKEEILRKINDKDLQKLAESVSSSPVDRATSRQKLIEMVSSSLSIREIRTRVKEMRAPKNGQIIIPYEGIAVGVTAILGLMFLASSHMLLRGGMGLPPTVVSYVDVSGLDLAQGVFHYFSFEIALGFSIPFVWLVVAGTIVVTIPGFASAVPTPAFRMHFRTFSSLVIIGGSLVLAGSIATVFQLITEISVFTLSVYGLIWSASIGWGGFAEVSFGAVEVILGATMFAKSR